MRVPLKRIILTLVISGFVLAILSFQKEVQYFLSFADPGFDIFINIVGGDNPYLKIVVFFFFWVFVIFGGTTLLSSAFNVYKNASNLPFEERSTVEHLLLITKEEVALLLLSLDFILLSMAVLFFFFKSDLSNLLEQGFSYNMNLIPFWVLFTFCLFVFFTLWARFYKMKSEVDEMEHHFE